MGPYSSTRSANEAVSSGALTEDERTAVDNSPGPAHTWTVTEPARVKVHLDEDGKLAGLDIDGDLDRENLIEETPGRPSDPPQEDIYRPERFWGAGS